MALQIGQAASRSTHFADLDGVRGILALTVMLYHYGINVIIARATHGMVPNAAWGLAVDFFFALSGFVMCRSYFRRARSASHRFIERVFRLFPIHLIILVAFIPVYYIGRESNMWIRATDTDSYWPRVFDFLAISTFTGTSRWNGPSWSMNIELYLPVLLAFLVPFLWRMRKHSLIALLAVLAIADGLLTVQVALGNEGLLVLRGLCGLSLGGVVYALVDQGYTSSKASSWILPSIVVVMLIVYALSGTMHWLAAVCPIIGAFALIFGMNSRSMFGWAPFQWLGKISYTSYMVHQPLKSALLVYLGVDELGGNIPMKLGLIVATLIIADILSRTVELPMMRFGKRFSAQCEFGSDEKNRRTGLIRSIPRIR